MDDDKSSNEPREQENTQLIDHKNVGRRALQARNYALILAIVTMILISGLAIYSLVLGIVYDSNAALVFSADGLLDCLDSIVIIWRFYDVRYTYSPRRELIGCIVLAVFSFISSISLFIRSSFSFIIISDRLEPVNTLWIVSLVGGCLCLVLAIGKFYASYILRSVVVFTDGVNSAIGALMAFTSVADVMVVEHNPSAWFMDPTVGYVFAIFFGIYGIWLLCSQVKKVPTS